MHSCLCHASENILAFLSKESFKFDALQFHVETTVEYTQEEKKAATMAFVSVYNADATT